MRHGRATLLLSTSTLCLLISFYLPSSTNCETVIINQESTTFAKMQLVKGTTIRVLTHNLPPVVFVNWNSSSGYPSELSGYAPVFLNLISQRFQFSYTWIPLGRNIFTDSTPTLKGFLQYLIDGEGDLIMSPMVQRAERQRLIDYTMPILEGPFGVMIPFPENGNNRYALYKPFQLKVWVCVLVSLVLVVITWQISELVLFSILRKTRTGRAIISHKDQHRSMFTPIDYVITVLLNQGNYCASRLRAVRIIAGTWCLACLVVVPAYSSNLLSFIVSPTVKPLIRSIYDIPNVPGLKVAVDRNLAAETNIMRALVSQLRKICDDIVRCEQAQTADVDSTSYKNISIIVEKTMFRCNTTAACIDKVLDGTHAYLHGRPVLEEYIYNDLKRTGRCRFTLAKEPFGKGMLSWGLAKRSPYSYAINNGLLELDAFGLSNYWRDKFSKKATKCTGADRRMQNGNSKQTRLTWPTISTTFILLGAGYGFSVLAFLLELLTRYAVKIRNVVVL